MKKTYFFIFTLLVLIGSSSFRIASEPTPEADSINWMSIEEAYAAAQKSPRKIIIDVYTDWCGWCKVMDKKTFTNPEVIKYINRNYYAVKLNAESKKDITVGTTTYKYNEASRANDIAIALLQGKMSFPSMVYLDEQFNMIQPIAGYLDARQFHEIITFIGDDYHKKEKFDAYKAGTYKILFKEVIAML